MSNIGFGEIIVILLIVLILFGASKLPEIGKSLGRAIYEFKKAMKDAGEDDNKTNAKKD
ncbi:MAG: twin-arginine translocase TatA/TatE family subunit [Candidatus Omnitrophica bacterium]|nr:twin-arginine translocase TatA/TatE family subunit [Candidatus Omnitrophota bacterium]